MQLHSSYAQIKYNIKKHNQVKKLWEAIISSLYMFQTIQEVKSSKRTKSDSKVPDQVWYLLSSDYKEREYYIQQLV